MERLRDELQQQADKVKLTDDHASSEVWPALFAFLCIDAVAQPTSHALQAQDRPLFPSYLWPGRPLIHIIVVIVNVQNNLKRKTNSSPACLFIYLNKRL